MVSNILWCTGRLAKGVNIHCEDLEGCFYLERQAFALHWSDSGLCNVQGWQILLLHPFPVFAEAPKLYQKKVAHKNEITELAQHGTVRKTMDIYGGVNRAWKLIKYDQCWG